MRNLLTPRTIDFLLSSDPERINKTPVDKMIRDIDSIPRFFAEAELIVELNLDEFYNNGWLNSSPAPDSDIDFDDFVYQRKFKVSDCHKHRMRDDGFKLIDPPNSGGSMRTRLDSLLLVRLSHRYALEEVEETRKVLDQSFTCYTRYISLLRHNLSVVKKLLGSNYISPRLWVACKMRQDMQETANALYDQLKRLRYTMAEKKNYLETVVVPALERWGRGLEGCRQGYPESIGITSDFKADVAIEMKMEAYQPLGKDSSKRERTEIAEILGLDPSHVAKSWWCSLL
ncbi:hypothetical protein ABW19_dt0208213 [Dactylella cylindrospora]|nr:hypothetical protein ABW19_dt0208213 [Dactylella cylindrospora]